jgi:hypothetical protein
VRGARHDAYAFEASGLKELLEKSRNPDETAADLGYIGVDGIGTVPFRKPKGGQLKDWRREFNACLSKIRAAVEYAVAKMKAWRMLSEEGGRAVPLPDRQVREHADGRYWTVLLS